MTVDETLVAAALRESGAVFAFVHGSRANDGPHRPDSDLDVGAWWPGEPPAAWNVGVPSYVDLVVLNTAPPRLAGRIAQHGRLILEVDPAARVAWQGDTRLRYLDDLPAMRARLEERRRALARGRTLGDAERVDRLLARIAADLRDLSEHRGRRSTLPGDRTALAAVKYLFVVAIEGVARVAHHLIAAQGWPVADANADALRTLGSEGVLSPELAAALARAVGFRNVLVHQYAEVDDTAVVANLERLGDLEAFVAQVAAWVEAHREGESAG